MRTRILKPDFFTNEELAVCEPLARILYAGLWCFADKFGLFEWRPLKMKAQIFPLDVCNVEPLLEQLLKQELIFEYSINGKTYGIIPTFLKYQSPHKNEKDSGIPLPDENYKKLHEKVKRGTIYINKYSFKYIKNDTGKFGEFKNVKLTDEQLAQLEETMGKKTTQQYIEKLSGYMASKGKQYKSHYATILGWWRKAGGETEKKRVVRECKKCRTYMKGMKLDENSLCEKCGGKA